MPGSRLRALHHILVLWAFAVAQPSFELLESNVAYLRTRGIDAIDLTLIALGLVLVVPGVFSLAKNVLERTLPRAAASIHWGTVALLAAAITLVVLKEGDAEETPGWVLAPAAGIAGIGAASLYARARFVPLLLTLLSPVLLLLPALFLLRSPVSEIFIPSLTQSEASEAPGIPVVVVVFDGLPLSSLLDDEGRIDAGWFPHFAAMAQGAHFFRNATTVAESAAYALPAIVSGMYPAWSRQPLASEYPDSLFTLLEASHALNVFEPLTRVCPIHVCHGGRVAVPRLERLAEIASGLPLLYLHAVLPEDWVRRSPRLVAAWKQLGAHREDPTIWRQQLRRNRSDLNWVFSEFLARVVSAERPALHFLHANLPGGEVRYLPSGAHYRPTAILPSLGPSRDPREANWNETQALQRHLLQVGFADTFLGRLRNRLESEGLYDRALLVVTATRGVAFSRKPPRGALDPRTRYTSDTLQIPLLIKLPGQIEGHVSDRNVETIDILPSILDVLALEPPRPLDGHSLLDPSTPERREKIVYRTRVDSGPLRREATALPSSLPGARKTVRRISRSFERGDGLDAIRATGHNQTIVGRRVADLITAEVPPALTIRLDDPMAYSDVDPGSDFLPALVSGTIEGPDPPAAPATLAVALNGTIRASTLTFRDVDGRMRFSAMVSGAAFRAGSNDLDILLLEAIPGGIGIARAAILPATTFEIALSHDGSPGLLVSSEGGLYPVVPDAVRGDITRRGRTVFGEALDVRQSRLAESIAVFERGEFLEAHALAATEFEALRTNRAPFHFELYGAPRDSSALRFFALMSRAAAEITPASSDPAPMNWPRAGVTLAIELRDGNEGVSTSSGAWIPIDSGGGRLEEAARGDRRLSFAGWSARTIGVRGPAALLVFVDGRFAATAAFNRPGADGPERLGFAVEFPADLVAEGNGVRFFVPSAGGGAMELDYPDAYAFAAGD